ncbi:MAG TPA: hypothetical protein VHU44_01460 [Acidobacteriaceae bacterium]|nr:hypothetical protein [Acidobacteriaceae bacterium]
MFVIPPLLLAAAFSVPPLRTRRPDLRFERAHQLLNLGRPLLNGARFADSARPAKLESFLQEPVAVL